MKAARQFSEAARHEETGTDWSHVYQEKATLVNEGAEDEAGAKGDSEAG